MGAKRVGDVAGKRRYVCPDCGNTVVMHIVFSGWEDEKIDPDTGDAYRLISSERSDIHDIGYFCPRYQCFWEGDEEWFDSIGEDEDEA